VPEEILECVEELPAEIDMHHLSQAIEWIGGVSKFSIKASGIAIRIVEWVDMINWASQATLSFNNE
jgi:hypothetical protein